MKKLSKINLTLDKEVISSLSGNEMNNVKGGTAVTHTLNVNVCKSNNGQIICVPTNPTIPIETGSKCVSCEPQSVVCTIAGAECYTNICYTG